LDKGYLILLEPIFFWGGVRKLGSQDRLNMGIYGYTSYFVSARKFLDARSLYYPDYKQFNGGESFFFNAVQGSFHFLITIPTAPTNNTWKYTPNITFSACF